MPKTAAVSDHLARAGVVPTFKPGDLRISPYMPTERHPTRCTVERYEYSDCYGRKIWRAIGTYDNAASARAAFPRAVEA
jgi:hypothetical protein